MARKGILARNSIILDPKGCSWLKKAPVAQNSNLSSIISMMTSDRRLHMWLESFVWKLPQSTCEIKDTRTDHHPTVSVCLFEGMNVTLTNIIIFMPVHITILIMAENVPAFVVPPLPARNPVN